MASSTEVKTSSARVDSILLAVSSVTPCVVLLALVSSIDLTHILFRDLPSMVPATAICILLLAFSRFQLTKVSSKFSSRMASALTLAVTLVYLTNYFLNAVGLSLFSTSDNASRDFIFGIISPQSCFALSGIATAHIIFGLREYEKNATLRKAFQALNLFALFVSLSAGLGYIYAVTELFSISQYIGMSILTGVSVFCLAVSTLRLEPEYGAVRVFLQQNSAGFFVRNFIVGGIIAPFTAAGVIRWAELHQGISSNFGMAAFVFFTVSSILALGVTMARTLERIETQKIQISLQKIESAEINEAGKLRDKFLANMSHEIRTPLTAIVGYLDVLSETKHDAPETADLTKRAKRSARSLQRVLDDILDLSKISADRIRPQMSAFSVVELAHDVISQISLEAQEKKIAIRIDLDPNLPEALVTDANRLQQILTNLLSNAVKFTDRGEIRILATYKPQIDIPVTQDGVLNIEVSDTGIGIPLEAQGKIFKNFFQVDDSLTRRFGGSGIGLALSEQLALLLGGRLFLKTSDVTGSTFGLTIPCGIGQRLRSAEPQTPARMDQAPSLAGLKILLVDDNSDNQFLLQRILFKLGAVTESAENGKVGLEKALSNSYSLILMDIQMPIMGGLEATRALRASGYKHPIIALSAHTADTDREKSMDAGCDAHAKKPIVKSDLVAAISDVLAIHAQRKIGHS